MYRTSEIKDTKLQKIISKEILNGFDDTFAISSNNPTMITALVKDFFDDMGSPIKSEVELNLFTYKIIGMYKELADTSYQYTFDEHGEWILAKVLLEKLSIFELFLDDENHEDAEIDEFWETSLSEEEIEYVKAFADDYFEDKITELAQDDDTSISVIREELYEQKRMFIDRVTYFPLMAFELTDDVTPEFLFWDRDFLLIDNYGIENFENVKNTINSNGIDMGFCGVNEATELYTGSERFEL